MPRVVRSRQALHDLLEIWSGIARHNPAAADDLTDSFNASLATLARVPGMGRARDELRPGLRSFPVRKYLLIYKKIPGGVELVRVIHGARDLRRVFRGP
jgi:toxin ParE1/3/4